MTSDLRVSKRVSTAAVAEPDRVPFWNEHNIQNLVGLRCSAYSEDGLLAQQTNLASSGLNIADIRGNEHVIERPPEFVRAYPKEAMFVSFLLEGYAFHYQNGICLNVNPGELVVYDTTMPYLFGFTSSMRQILVDIPRETFRERCLQHQLAGPVKLGARSGSHQALAAVLRRVLVNAVDDPMAASAQDVESNIYDLLLGLMLDHAGQGGKGPASATHLLVAKDYVDRNIADPGLTAERVARATGVSLRHLNRLFVREETTVAQFITQRRLDRARTDIAGSGQREAGIAEVAYRWGFASHAHFTRVFKARFGHTPSHARDRADAC